MFLKYSAEVAYRVFHIAHEQNLEMKMRNETKCRLMWRLKEELKSYYLGHKAYMEDSLSYLDLPLVLYRIMYTHLTLLWH